MFNPIRPFLSVLRLCRARIEARWHTLRPAQKLILGFASYVVTGVLLLSLPVSQKLHVSVIDNLFNVTSAISTTGLTTVSVADSYSFPGQLILLLLFQFGGIGYMTVSSFIILARGNPLSASRLDILQAEFALPRDFNIRSFVRNVVLFTLVIESLGILLLYGEFRQAGVHQPLWSATFHCVSAFATAGFGLHNNSLCDFAHNPVVCATIGTLCYLGSIGFIVIQDAWHAIRYRRYHITFTSKVILVTTAAIFLIATPIFALTDPSLLALPLGTRWLAAAFQVMTASTTAGFNTVPIEALAPATLTLTIVIMVIGASPSGTGGGIKTTSFSSLMAILLSITRGRQHITFLGHEIPLARLLSAVASITLYLSCLTVGLFLLCLFEPKPYIDLAFEATSALGTVGLSMGITSALTLAGKLILTSLMFIGRVGPLTIGLALLEQKTVQRVPHSADLAV
ncbi:MAG: potassium transporter TrkG [Phycisphaeraceae bacterium]